MKVLKSKAKEEEEEKGFILRCFITLRKSGYLLSH
jgi:hypothetical protein